MERKSLRIFLACAAGAFVGTVVSLEVNTYLWWLGTIVGGMLGYLFYDLKDVHMAIPMAWKKTKKNSRDLLRIFVIKLCWLFIASLYAIAFWIMVALMVTLTLAILFLPVLHYSNDNQILLSFMISVQISAVLGGVTCLFLLIITMVPMVMHASFGVENKEELIQLVQFGRLLWREYKPSVMIRKSIHIVRATPRFVWGVVMSFSMGVVITLRGICTLIKMVRRFIKTLFLLVHSEERLLCLVDAMLGTVVGYFYGNALIGALAGGIFGVINFEIVSKRLLKLKPVSSGS